MVKTELKRVASSQKFEVIGQSTKSDDVLWHFVYFRPAPWRIYDANSAHAEWSYHKQLSVLQQWLLVPLCSLLSLLRRGVSASTMYLLEVKESLMFSCELEPRNARDENSIVLKCCPTATLGHLAREASVHLAPLLRRGFQAEGWVLSLSNSFYSSLALRVKS